MITLITGAASSLGIGRATALALARPSARLALCDVDGDELEETAELCLDLGAEVATAIVDVSDTGSVDRGIATFRGRFGQIDALIANAGIARRRPFVDISDREWSDVMETNFGGVWRCARAVLPGMIAQRAGRIVSVSSLMGSPWGWSEHVHYSASKAAVEGLTRALAVEAGPFGVTVNAVAPGFIRTNQSLDAVNSGGEEGMRKSVGFIPLKRIGGPEDVAEVIAFLCSDAARYVTGQVLLVDGGITLGDLSPLQVWPAPPAPTE
ncbi:MAG: SDR family oxidoreductase [Actinomycetota bacterium]|nr:SDR family oxidoreductase [Actinomycetota bacterium]